MFFKFASTNIWDPTDDVVAFIVAGDAFDDQEFDLVDRKNIHCVVRSLKCYGFEQPEEIAIARVRLFEPLEIDPNGFSGGAVFAICFEHSTTVAKFAGVINRAGRDAIHFIKASYVSALLKAASKS